MTEADFRANQFNPGQVDEIAEIQKEIDNAASAGDAYQVFAKFAKNAKGRMLRKNDNTVWEPDNIDLNEFKKKMKNMARMVSDYPELKGKIGKEDGVDRRNKRFLAGQLRLKRSKLAQRNITSRYGETDASEFFAEAFADVYAHADRAKPAGIELVKLYETKRGKP